MRNDSRRTTEVRQRYSSQPKTQLRSALTTCPNGPLCPHELTLSYEISTSISEPRQKVLSEEEKLENPSATKRTSTSENRVVSLDRRMHFARLKNKRPLAKLMEKYRHFYTITATIAAPSLKSRYKEYGALDNLIEYSQSH